MEYILIFVGLALEPQVEGKLTNYLERCVLLTHIKAPSHNKGSCRKEAQYN